MTVARILAALALASLAVSASAQYVWLDASGHKVFSDRAPPMDVPVSKILRQPGPNAHAPLALEPSTSPQTPPPPLKPSFADNELADRKKQAEAAEAAKVKADEARQAATRADNCQRARQAANTLDSGIRIAQVNAQGERVIMDDQARAAESQRTQAIVASECR